MIAELPLEELRKTCDSKLMHYETTAEISPLDGIIGQERAVRGLRFGIDIKDRGFNIYVAGYPGAGRTTAVKDFLEKVSKTKSVPYDWCYKANEKIECFFEVCKAKGLIGKPVVLIPKSNLKNLMLKKEIGDAVQTGKPPAEGKKRSGSASSGGE